MSNKQQLQTNNTKYTSLIETLRNKAIPSGSEDLDTELTTQENLISQLSTILDSKASGGSGGGAETCTVTVVQQWSGNDDPALLRVHVFAYDIEMKSVVDEEFSSLLDDEPEHSVTFNAYKNYPINIILTSISGSPEATTTITATGGTVLNSKVTATAYVVSCMPTSDNATFTFISP